MNESIKELYKSAETELDQAWEEMCRPSTDVVTYSACVGSRRALYHFLRVVVMLSGDESADDVSLTMDELIALGRTREPKLNAIDFTEVHCKCDYSADADPEEEVFCDSVEKVQFCVDLARQVQSIIKEKGFEA